MQLQLDTRMSDSTWVASVWTCGSDQVAQMTSVACETWGLVFWEQDGVRFASVSGPERATSTAPVPEGARFVGIQLAVGTSLRCAPASSLVDGGFVLPDVTRTRFWLDGGSWETPGPDDAEALVERLVGYGVVVRDPVVTAHQQGHHPRVSSRTLERRYRAATGLTRGDVAQIDRVRTAAGLLAAGTTSGDVVEKLGFYDEPHLARALRRYVGRTAGELRAGGGGAIALDVPQRTTS